MNDMKKFTTKGIIACALMGLVVILLLFGNILVLRGKTLDELEDAVEEFNDDKEREFERYDVDDMEEYLEELDYSKREIKAGVKMDKFVNRIEDGKISVFDVISTISCFSAMENAPDIVGGFDADETMGLAVIRIVGVVLVFGYMLMPLLGVLYLVLHFRGYKNKGIPVLVLLVLFIISVGGFTTIMTLAGAMQGTISFTYIIALACAIASIVLWKVEKAPQVQGS